jgi:hypothetical protein
MKKFILLFSFIITSVMFAQPQWSAVSSGLTMDIWGIDWLNSSVVWITATGSATTTSQVAKSTNGGLTWTPTTPLPQGGAFSIAVLDENTAVIATGPGSGDGRIYRTTNGGSTWTQVYTASTAWFNFVDNISATELWAQSDPIGNSFHIVRSTDAGATWQLAQNLPAAPATNVYGANGSFYRIGNVCWFGTGGATGATLANRVYKSTNGPNGPWTFGTAPSQFVGTIAFSTPTGPGVAAFWNNTTSVGKSADGGATWAVQTVNIGAVHGVDYVTGTDFVWAATSTGIHQSSDNGTSWTANTVGATAEMNVIRFFGDAVNGLCGGLGGVLLRSNLPSVVPVELTSFTAAAVGSTVTLNWSTASEINNRGFEVEKSLDNEDFRVIGFVNGFGTTTETKNYTFSENNLSGGTYYYRLKQIDFNGQYEYSPVVEANVISPVEFALVQNYPNPFNPSTKIMYSIASAGNVKLAVYNLLGQEVATLVNGYMEAGNYELNFNAADLSSGTYIYKIETAQFTQARKMLLTK